MSDGVTYIAYHYFRAGTCAGIGDYDYVRQFAGHVDGRSAPVPISVSD